MDSAEGAKYLKKYMADGEFIVSLFEKTATSLKVYFIKIIYS